MTAVRLPAITLAALFFVVSPLAAQQADSGTVQLTVEESMGMLDGFLVQSAGRSTTTDATGRARLILPTGRQVISITRIGFKPSQVTVVVVRDSVVAVQVTATMNDMVMELEDVKVSATRTERLAGETPSTRWRWTKKR
jgi:hypothetical protein